MTSAHLERNTERVRTRSPLVFRVIFVAFFVDLRHAPSLARK